MKTQLRKRAEPYLIKAYHAKQRYFGKFVFVRINKTGTSSIQKSLNVHFPHNTALEHIDELGMDQWDRRFTFTIVRNPWDKVVSHYHYRVKTNQTGLKDEGIGFNEWVKRSYGDNEPSYYDKPKMFMPQCDWISSSEGKVLVDFVGRFESLETDFQEICQHLNTRKTLPHVKFTKRGNYRKYYDSEAKEIIATWFVKDIDKFGYMF